MTYQLELLTGLAILIVGGLGAVALTIIYREPFLAIVSLPFIIVGVSLVVRGADGPRGAMYE